MEKNALSMENEREEKVGDSGGCVKLEMNNYMTQMIANIIAHATFGVAMKKEGECLDTNLHLSILQFKDLNLVQYHVIGSFDQFCHILT
jgi:hypothetical protein